MTIIMVANGIVITAWNHCIWQMQICICIHKMQVIFYRCLWIICLKPIFRKVHAYVHTRLQEADSVQFKAKKRILLWCDGCVCLSVFVCAFITWSRAAQLFEARRGRGLDMITVGACIFTCELFTCLCICVCMLGSPPSQFRPALYEITRE